MIKNQDKVSNDHDQVSGTIPMIKKFWILSQELWSKIWVADFESKITIWWQCENSAAADDVSRAFAKVCQQQRHGSGLESRGGKYLVSGAANPGKRRCCCCKRQGVRGAAANARGTRQEVILARDAVAARNKRQEARGNPGKRRCWSCKRQETRGAAEAARGKRQSWLDSLVTASCRRGNVACGPPSCMRPSPKILQTRKSWAEHKEELHACASL